MDDWSDAELVTRARAGDAHAFGLLAARHQAPARRAARRLVPQAELAEDLVQEAVLQAYLSLDRLRTPERFGAWLLGIVRNVGRSAHRARPPATFSLEALTGGVRFEAIGFSAMAPDPAELAERRELGRQVQEAIGRLPAGSRAAALLFYGEDRSLQEIATRLDLSIVAVKSRLHAARRQLRVQLPPPAGPPARRAGAAGRFAMVPMTIADVIASGPPDAPRYVVILWDGPGRRILPIWIGPAEALAIAGALQALPTARPLTYSFISSLLAALDATVEEVRIVALRDSVYYAEVALQGAPGRQALDARPSDALALAARMGGAVRVAEAVLAEAAIAVPVAQGAAPNGQGSVAIAAELQQQWAALAPGGPGPDPAQRAQESAVLLARVFGPAGMQSI